MNNIDQIISEAQTAATPTIPSNLTMIVTDFSYEAYIEAGHTNETLVRDGLAKLNTPPAPSPSTSMAPAPAPIAPAPAPAPMAVIEAAPLAPIDMSMGAMMNQGFTVDTWVKTSFYGLSIGKELCQPFEAEINMFEGQGFKPNQSIRYGANPVNYDKTFDGITAEDGAPWASRVSSARGIDPKCRPYRSVQVAMTATHDIVSSEGGTVLAKAGSIIGYTTSITGWAEWESFYRNCVGEGVLNSNVRVKVSNNPKSKGANTWGILRWELLRTEVEVKKTSRDKK